MMAADAMRGRSLVTTPASTASERGKPAQWSAGANPVAVMGALLQDPSTVSVSLSMSSDTRAARTARRFVIEQLDEWGCAALEDAAELICSELVTNAVVHGRTRPPDEEEVIHLDLTLQPGTALVIQLVDNSPLPPVPRVTGQSAESGRGLRLVTALADVWTSWPNSNGLGKKVWVYLRCPQVSTAT